MQRQVTRRRGLGLSAAATGAVGATLQKAGFRGREDTPTLIEVPNCTGA